MSEMDTLYGSSHIYTESGSDLSSIYSAKFGHRCLPLALNAPDSSQGVFWDVAGPGHGCTFGSNRSGKGAGGIVPALLTYPYGCVVLDPKGENLWVTGDYRARSPDHPNGGLGQRVIALDPWEETTRRYGSKVGVTVPLSTFNPLSILDPKSLDFADQVAQLAEGIIIAGGSTEPHWPESARELVGGLIAAVAEAAVRDRKNEPPTFRQVREALTKSDEELALYIKRICERMPDSLAARKLARFAESTREVASIRSTAITQTAILDAGRLMRCMDTGPDSFDLNELATRRVTLYLVLPVDRLTSHGKWLGLMLQLAMRTAMMHNPSIDRPTLFILDELGTITSGRRGGGLPLVSQAFGLSAGLGVRLWCFFQDINQLQRDYPESWQTFLANSAMVQVLRVNDNNTAQYFSQRIGTKTIKEKIRTNNPNLANLINPEYRYHGRQVMMPEEIMRMPAGQTILLFPEGRYFRLTQVPYFKESRFYGRYRPNPDYPSPVAPVRPPPPPPPFDWAAFWQAHKRKISIVAACLVLALLVTRFVVQPIMAARAASQAAATEAAIEGFERRLNTVLNAKMKEEKRAKDYYAAHGSWPDQSSYRAYNAYADEARCLEAHRATYGRECPPANP